MKSPCEGWRRLQTWAVLPPALLFVSVSLAFLGFSLPNHTPPPSEFDKFGDPTFSARDQP